MNIYEKEWEEEKNLCTPTPLNLSLSILFHSFIFLYPASDAGTDEMFCTKTHLHNIHRRTRQLVARRRPQTSGRSWTRFLQGVGERPVEGWGTMVRGWLCTRQHSRTMPSPESHFVQVNDERAFFRQDFVHLVPWNKGGTSFGQLDMHAHTNPS